MLTPDAVEVNTVEADADAVGSMHKTIKNEIAVCFYILAKNSSVSTHTVQNQYLWQVEHAYSTTRDARMAFQWRSASSSPSSPRHKIISSAPSVTKYFQLY